MRTIGDWGREGLDALADAPDVAALTIPVDELGRANGRALATLGDAITEYATLINVIRSHAAALAAQLEVSLPESTFLDTRAPRLGLSEPFDDFHPPRFRLIRRTAFCTPLITEGFRVPVDVDGVRPPETQAVYACIRGTKRSGFLGDDYERSVVITHYPPELQQIGAIR